MPNDTDGPRIECKTDGPYFVTGLDTLTDPQGRDVEPKEKMVLCRCGGSANKPFCDGTHRNNGFTDAKQEDRTPDQRDTYAGRHITIHDNRSICAHAGECTDGLASVWRMHDEPWIDPDGAEAAAIIAVIERCPSGALSYSLAAGAPAAAGAGPAVQALKDGPYLVTGVDLADQQWADGANRGRFTLCRCGASKNKPFCDGSHWAAEFKDNGDG